MHGAGGGAPEENMNGNFRHGGRTKEAIDTSAFTYALTRLGSTSDRAVHSNSRGTRFNQEVMRVKDPHS
jgi:hypothetical protein